MADNTEQPKKGVNRGNAGKGRPKGSRNKTTALLKDAILKAADAAGNKVGEEGMVSYLTEQAEQNPGPFMALLGKVLPMDVTNNGGDFKPTEIIIRAASDD